MNNNNLAGVYAFSWIFAVLLAIILPEVPYFLYFYIGSPVLVLGGMILNFRLGFDKESKERKRKHEEYLKEKPERDRKIELEKKKNLDEWNRLSQSEKVKILKVYNETEYSDRFWQNHKQYKAITEERDKWRQDEWNRIPQAEKDEILKGDNEKKYGYDILISKKVDKEVKKIIDETNKTPVHLQKINADRLWKEYLKKLVYENRREESQIAAINWSWKQYLKKLDEEKRLRNIRVREENEKEFSQTLTINKNTMDNSLINSFSYEQKLSIIAMMKMISHGSQDVYRSKLQQEIISKQESLFELSSLGCSMFLNNPNNVEIMEKVLIPLNNSQKDYIVGLALKVLLSGGTTNKRENMIAENVFKLFLNINSDELLNRFQRAQTIGNYYTK